MKNKQVEMGINYVRPPELKFKKLKSSGKCTEYEITTFKDAKTKASDESIVIIRFILKSLNHLI